MSEEYDNDGVVRDSVDAIKWLPEAMDRLHDELACMYGHWNEFTAFLEKYGSSEPTEAIGVEDSTMQAAHIYAMVNHATQMSKAFYQVGDILFTHLAPQAVKQQLMQDVMEQSTGMPMTVHHAGDGFVIFSPGVDVPNDVSELTREDEDGE